LYLPRARRAIVGTFVRVGIAPRRREAYQLLFMGQRAKRARVTRWGDEGDPAQILSLSIPTPIGRLWLAAGPNGLVRIELPGPNAELRMNVWLALHFPASSIRTGVTPILKKATTQLQAYFTSGLTDFTVPVALVGTPFQVDVWSHVATIPFGQTRSYRDVAGDIGRPRAVRAVGGAQSVNPVPIIVACHRVIAADGGLAGYAGGIETKKWLLEHEAAYDHRITPPRPLVDVPSTASRRRRIDRDTDRPGTMRPLH
jgi:methylated-DNA-[protein]-cysteine S-methyltransferase